MDDREKEEVGKITGGMAGALGGARLAAHIFPVPVVGSFAGSVVGGLVGSEVGRRLGKALINGAAAFVDTMREAAPSADPAGGGAAYPTPVDPSATGTAGQG